jgi:internalin A
MRKIAALFLIATFLLLPSVCAAKGAQVVSFDDPVLETALRKAVGIPQGDVTDSDLAKVTVLQIERQYEDKPDPSTQVHSIAILAYCTKLTTLQLNFQNITDMSPLSNLKKLKKLEVGGNPIADITALANLTSLQELALYNCQAKDYSPLAKLKKLTVLFLDYSTIADLTPLSGLKKLKTLGLKRTAVTDVTPLAKLGALRTLNLAECTIQDYTPIRQLYGKLQEKDFELLESTPTPVGEVVAFDDPVLENYIRQALNKPEGDVYSNELAELTDLGTGMDYEQNPPEGSRIKSIQVLKNCVNLTRLELTFQQITDISALAGLTRLTELSIGGNEITDISPLAGLTELKSLALFNCRATDYSPLANLTQLQSLLLEFSTITDLTPLAGLTNLRTLHLKECLIEDFTPIAAILPTLTDIDFDPAHPVIRIVFNDPILESLIRNASGIIEGDVTDRQAAQITELGFERYNDRPANEDIFNLSALQYCTGLRQLTLNNISATDLSPIAKLTGLEGLNLRYCKATDYSALTSLARLTWLDLSHSAITDFMPLSRLTALEALTLCYTDITDLSPLQSMTHLFGLKLEGTPVKDYSPIAALYPNLGKRDFILPVPGEVQFCDELLEARVRTAMNQPEGTITPEAVASVSTLDLSQDENSQTSISLLQGLEAFTGLKELNLSGNKQLGDLWPLSELYRLEKLNCWQCNIQNLKPLSKLTSLQELSLGWNGSVGNLDALSGLVSLVALDAKGVGITDISGLSGLPKLQYVGLNGNKITDFSPLATLPSLNAAELKDNLTEDYSALTEIYPKLEYKDFTLDDMSAVVSDVQADPLAGWQYDKTTHTLTITSDEAMIDYAPDQENAEMAKQTNAPWADSLSQIEQIVVSDTVTHISDYAFAYTSALKQVTIGKGVTSLGWRCLYRCGNWQGGRDLEIFIRCASMPTLGTDAFGYTWDNPHAFLNVPTSQIDQWNKLMGVYAIRIVAD